MYSAVTLVVLRGSQAGGAGAARRRRSSSSDILGTALGTGVAGAITAAGTRAGGDGLGVALAAVFAMSAWSPLFWACSRARSAGPHGALGARSAAAVD